MFNVLFNFVSFNILGVVVMYLDPLELPFGALAVDFCLLIKFKLFEYPGVAVAPSGWNLVVNVGICGTRLAHNPEGARL